MLSANRLTLNQKLYKLIDNNHYIATRHTYESVNAIYDITILDINGYTLYEKNCRFITDRYHDIPVSDRKFYDFINENIKVKASV